MSSLEKELAEARNSLAAGSSTKAEEAEKTRRQLEEALARSAQVSKNETNRIYQLLHIIKGGSTYVPALIHIQTSTSCAAGVAL